MAWVARWQGWLGGQGGQGGMDPPQARAVAALLEESRKEGGSGGRLLEEQGEEALTEEDWDVVCQVLHLSPGT